MNVRLFKRKPKTGAWLIRCGPANPNWQVRLEDCDEVHAMSVLAQLRADPTCPDDVRLERAD